MDNSGLLFGLFWSKIEYSNDKCAWNLILVAFIDATGMSFHYIGLFVE